MRSDLIFGAQTHVESRYLLCRLAAKATHKMHRPNTRVQDTINDVLIRFKHQGPSPALRFISDPAHAPRISKHGTTTVEAIAADAA